MVKSIYDKNFKGKKVLVRVDFNVPFDENLNITDDSRIKLSLPTINKIIADGGIPILMSHLGRPKGKVNLKYSLKPVAEYLQNHFHFKVKFATDCIGEETKELVASSEIGEIILLENLRFHPEEEENNVEFSKALSELGDCYVNDAFGSAHRAHASTEGVANYFENDKYAGLLMLNELKYLGESLNNPKKPFVAIIGGSKISGKIDVIKNLMSKCNTILIGGGMTFTFFKALGFNIGKSLLEEDKIQLASELLEEAKRMNVKLLLPLDITIANEFKNEADRKNVLSNNMPEDWIGMDIGSESQKLFREQIVSAKTIFWNGPMGVFEMENFSKGTYEIANALKDATIHGAISIVGGGDSASAINNLGFNEFVSHVSTGGGASLEFLEGKILPGVAALEIKG